MEVVNAWKRKMIHYVQGKSSSYLHIRIEAHRSSRMRYLKKREKKAIYR